MVIQRESATYSVASSGSRFVETIEERYMKEPMITCPECQTEIKLIESFVILC